MRSLLGTLLPLPGPSLAPGCVRPAADRGFCQAKTVTTVAFSPSKLELGRSCQNLFFFFLASWEDQTAAQRDRYGRDENAVILSLLGLWIGWPCREPYFGHVNCQGLERGHVLTPWTRQDGELRQGHIL